MGLDSPLFGLVLAGVLLYLGFTVWPALNEARAAAGLDNRDARRFERLAQIAGVVVLLINLAVLIFRR